MIGPCPHLVRWLSSCQVFCSRKARNPHQCSDAVLHLLPSRVCDVNIISGPDLRVWFAISTLCYLGHCCCSPRDCFSSLTNSVNSRSRSLARNGFAREKSKVRRFHSDWPPDGSKATADDEAFAALVWECSGRAPQVSTDALGNGLE